MTNKQEVLESAGKVITIDRKRYKAAPVLIPGKGTTLVRISPKNPSTKRFRKLRKREMA